MDIIISGRQSGKTTRLIRKASEEWLYIVCIDRREAHRVASEARQLGHNIPYPVTFEEVVRGEFSRRGIKGFLFDNVDIMLSRMARGVRVVAMTATNEDA